MYKSVIVAPKNNPFYRNYCLFGLRNKKFGTSLIKICGKGNNSTNVFRGDQLIKTFLM